MKNYDFYDEEVENEFLTPKEVMNLLFIGRNTFYKMVNSGELPAFRVGKLWRVRREDMYRICRQVESGHKQENFFIFTEKPK